MEKDRILYPAIAEFLQSARRERTGKIGEFEKWARGEKYPISQPETADLIEIICRLKRPEKILEIGTCVGFSSLLMYSVCDAKITTIDRYEAMYSVAQEEYKKFGAEDRIELLIGDAVDILPTIDDKYDFIFIDAAKGQYPIFLKECKRLLAKGGILMADNILFNGYVADGRPNRHRNKTIVVRLNEFIESLESDTDLKTVLLPISDGVSLSYYLGEQK